MNRDLPLSERVALRSSDLGEVNRFLARRLPLRRLEQVPGGRAPAARIHAVTLPSITPMYVSYGGDVVESHAEDGPYFFVHVTMAGHLVVTGQDVQVVAAPGHVAVASPGQELTLRWRPDTAAIVLRIDRRALETELVDLLDLPVEQPLRFRVGMDVGGRLAASWLNTAMFLVGEANQPGGLLEKPLVATDLERMLLRGLVLCQPHTYSAMLAEEAAHQLPRYVAAAVAMMEDMPERRLSPDSLARHVNVSTRVLHAGFRTHLGVSPMQYLRQLRLRRVHEDLTEGDPARRATVAEAAHRWGFSHLGRFAQDYRTRYGESPSQTLRRH
jgi:AraC-like DNA-binding protein